MLVYNCTIGIYPYHVTVIILSHWSWSLTCLTFATSFPHFEYAKHMQEIYTLYSRSEHVLFVKLKGCDNRKDFQIF